MIGAAVGAEEAAPVEPTAILAAMPRELATLRSRLVACNTRRVAGLRVTSGRLGRTPVWVAATGDGATRAALGARELLSRLPARRIVIVGVSGGLDRSLTPGAVVVASRVVRDGSPLPAPDAEWLGRAVALGLREATLVTSGEIACTARAKSSLLAELGGEEKLGAAAVDLETAAFAVVAAEHGLAYLALRAISDTADEDLPFDLNRYRDPQGGVVPLRVALHSAVRPDHIAPLWRLRRRVALCADRLADAVGELLSGDHR